MNDHNTTSNNNSCITEFINESELGENYMQNYIIEYDNEKNEYFIMDFTRKYKYVIIPNKSDLVESNNLNKTNLKLNYIEYGYVDESELKSLDTKKLAILKDNRTSEYYIQDYENENKKWIILVDNWNLLDNINYVSEEDIDPLEWTIHLDSNSNKKYIIDDDTHELLYVIPNGYLEEFQRHWIDFYKQRVRSSSLDMKDLDRDIKKDLIIEYVTEEELEQVDLLRVKILKDEHTNEYYIENPLNPYHRWIVLPKNWHKHSNEPYISEENIKDNKLKIYTEHETNRRFIYDANKNKIYVIPKNKDVKQSFKYQWNEINHKLNDEKSKKSDPMKIIDLPGSPRPLHHLMIDRAIDKKRKPSVEQNSRQNRHIQQLDKKKSVSNDFLDKTVVNQNKPTGQSQQQKKNVCFNEKVEVKDYELNESLANDNTNRQITGGVHFNENQKENENVIRIKQRGRMGHTIRPH